MRILYVVLFLGTTGLLGCSSGNVVYVGNNQRIRVDAQMAVLDGFQKSGALLGTLYSKQYFSTYIRPGAHHFTAMFNYDGDLKGNGIPTGPINLEPGKTYYFQVMQKPATIFQDITIVQHDEFKSLQAYKSSQPEPINSEPEMSLVYFYYQLPNSVNEANAKEAQKMKDLQKELGCTDKQMQNGTCQ